MTDFNTELTREQNATAVVSQIKDTIKTVATNKGISVGSTDTPLSVLSNIDNGTIATPTDTLDITDNGIKDVTNYASVNVNVPSEELTLGTKTITANGTYNASDDNLDGYSSVTVNVQSSTSDNKFASLVDRSITQVTAEDLSGATSIGEGAFYGCKSLSEIIIPSGVTSIGDNAFMSCSGLKTVTFGDNSQLESIGSSAFFGCINLTSIEIPSGVQSIGNYAFQDCHALATVTLQATTPPTIETYTFNNVPDITIYYVPDASVDAYKSATNWTTLADQIQPLSTKPTV